MNRRMIKAYFGQEDLYFSEGKGEFRRVAVMHPAHAANAAERLAREADFWSKEAGVEARRPYLWLAAQPLFIALAQRAEQGA